MINKNGILQKLITLSLIIPHLQGLFPKDFKELLRSSEGCHKNAFELKKLADKGDVESMYEYGMSLYLETPDYETALKYLLKAASYDFEPSYGDIGIIYMEMNNPETAEKWFIKADEANCLFPPAAYEYGMLICFEKNDDEKALEYFIAAADGEYEPSYCQIGTIFYYKNDLTIAQEWFDKAEKADCLFAPAAYDYGMLYLEKGNDDKALEYFITAAEGEYEPSYGEIGTILYHNNDLTTAQEWFVKAEEANCLFAPSAYNYGLLSLEKGNEDRALKYFITAADGEFELAYGEIGAILYHNNDLTTAQEWFVKAEEANCLFAPVAYEYGMLSLEKDNEGNALKYFIAAADEEYELAYEELGEIYKNRNEIEKSEMWFKKAADVKY